MIPKRNAMEGAGRAETQKIVPGEVKSEDNADLFLLFQGYCPQRICSTRPKR